MATRPGRMMALVAALCYAILLCSSSVEAQTDEENFFINPPRFDDRDLSRNQVWKRGQTKTIKWKTFYVKYIIQIWQEDLVGANDDLGVGTDVFTTDNAESEYGQFEWRVRPYDYNLTKSNVFSFGLKPEGQNGFLSFNFNISRGAAEKAETSASEASLSTSAARTSTSDASGAPATTSATPSDKPIQTVVATSNGMAQGTKIGIGVGVGLGLAIIGLLAAIAFLMVKKQRYRKTKEESQDQTDGPGMLPPPPAQKSPYMEDTANRSFIGGTPAAKVSWQELDGSARQSSTAYSDPPKTTMGIPPAEMDSGAHHTKPSGGHLVEMP